MPVITVQAPSTKTGNNSSGLTWTNGSDGIFTNAVAGDILVAIITSSALATPTINTPSGWTQLTQVGHDAGTASALAVFYIQPSGAQATTTFTSSDTTATNAMAGVMLRLRGHDTSDPFNTFATDDGVGSTFQITSPAVTTDAPDCWVMRAVASAQATSASAPQIEGSADNHFGYWTFQQVSNTGSVGMTLVTKAQYKTGASGTLLYSVSGPTSSRTAITFALNADPATVVPRIADESVFKQSNTSADITITPGSDGPTGITSGDVLVGIFTAASSATQTIAPPGDWTQIFHRSDDAGVAATTAAFYKIATGSEPSSYTFTGSSNSASDGFVGVMYRIVGAHPTTPLNTTQNNGSGSSPSSSRLITRNSATTVANCLVLTLCANSEQALQPAQDVEACILSNAQSLAAFPNVAGLSISRGYLSTATTPQGGSLTFSFSSLSNDTANGGWFAIAPDPGTETATGTLDVEFSIGATMEGAQFLPSGEMHVSFSVTAEITGEDRPNLPMLVRTGGIGCGEWTAYIAERGGSPIVLEVAFTSLSMGRVLNDSGQARLSIPAAASSGAACCQVLAEVEPWRHEIVLYRDSELVFAGPVLTLEGGPNGGSLAAQDLFVWTDVRFLDEDVFYSDDVSNIFHDLFDRAFAEDASANVTISTRETGVTAYRPWLGEDFHKIKDLLRELSNTALDFTVVGRKVLAGGLEVFLSNDPLILHDDGVIEATVTREGTQMATDVAVFGPSNQTNQRRVVGRATRSVSRYGLIQRSFAELQVQDTISATANAEARVESMLPAPIRVKASLSPEAAFDFGALIPGKRIDVRLSEAAGCMEVMEVMRLVSVDVNVSNGDSGVREAIEVQIDPLGLVTEGGEV